MCRPYGKNELPLYRTVPLIRHALRDTCPYPLWPLAIIPTPFGLRPFPPDRGNRPLDKGSRPPGEGLRAAARAAPTADNGAGALARQRQARLWKRCTCNFCKPRARWPGVNGGTPLRFCAPESFCPAQGITPVMGSGESSPMDLGGAKRSRSPSEASPAAFW